MKEYILEACVDSVESAMAAVAGGADRLELCSNLIIGGTTPGPWLFEEIRNRSDIRIHALIRPRFGDFCYTDAEFSVIKKAVEDFRKIGAEGVVFGILKPDGTLNMEQMKELMEAAGDMSVTLHRAFDVCVDPLDTMEQAISLGIDTILTSGQRNTCLQGAGLLKELQDKDVDTLILGCTHYPLIRSTIRQVMGEEVCLVNPAYETALELGKLLEEQGLSSTGTEQKEFPYRFYVSDLADEFKEFANSILPYDVEMTKKIDIEKY